MGRVYKGQNYKRVFSNGSGEAAAKNKYYPNPHSDGVGPRENQGLSPPF